MVFIKNCTTTFQETETQKCGQKVTVAADFLFEDKLVSGLSELGEVSPTSFWLHL